ncbi:glutamate-5-semialdehyde dehydrogenase [bacterium]|nr:glutamate-5-semialdehyde dehydrogenase [bacterium]MBU1615331.1 glutamate-5-semialdehyde dehydrogenase [bacterium]
MSIRDEVELVAKEAKEASKVMANLSSRAKDEALLRMASALEEKTEIVLAENRKDLDKGREANLSKALMDRLMLNDKRIKEMAEGLREVVNLPDPVGEITSMRQRPNGLMVGRMRVPLGVIGIIYEARPNVTADAAGLCLKSGNAILLRGGKEAINSNKAIAEVLMEAGKEAGLPSGAISIIKTTDREAVREMVKLDEYLDVIIPRGSQQMIKAILSEATVPVISHGAGICHIYIDSQADARMAQEIAFNAKVQRPGVCNALETLLVDSSMAKEILPDLARQFKEVNVILKGCSKTREILPDIEEAKEEDWSTEYLDLILSVKVVESYKEATEHIAAYGTGHTESIITSDYGRAHRFLREVDASTVMVNASTRFSDGHQFGLGAEIGISTQKLHARGPMGLVELTSTKFIVFGNGQIRE